MASGSSTGRVVANDSASTGICGCTEKVARTCLIPLSRSAKFHRVKMRCWLASQRVKAPKLGSTTTVGCGTRGGLMSTISPADVAIVCRSTWSTQRTDA